MSDIQGHSPLGASGASRWMVCPGSVGLSHGRADEQDDTFSRPGTAAHTLAETALKAGYDAWTRVGEQVNDVPVDKEMADAVQVYLEYVRTTFPDRHQGNSWVERRFHCPSIHKLFYGTSDFVFLAEEARTLYVVDYKHGAGIVVEVEGNKQLRYYACGVLEDLKLWDAVDKVVLVIVQPRGWHSDGPIRQSTVSTPELIAWLEDDLVPAMDEALVSRETRSGEHCRFCPARYAACPQILADLEELEAMLKSIEGRTAKDLTNAQVARLLDLREVLKIAVKAAEDTAFARLNSGHSIPGWKLAPSKVNREWKPGAEAALKKKYKDRAYTKPELKSPAAVDSLPEGEKITARWAFKPEAGLRVVKATDSRPAVNKDTKSLFTPVKKSTTKKEK